MGIDRADACGRRRAVWHFSAFFRSYVGGRTSDALAVRRTGRDLECNELFNSDQGLQGNSAFLSDRNCCDLCDRLAAAVSWSAACGRPSDGSVGWLWNHAFVGCYFAVSIFSAEGFRCFFISAMGG